MSLDGIVDDIRAERGRQDAKFGADRTQPDGTGQPGSVGNADNAKDICASAFRRGYGTWRHILNEEVAEAYAETDPALLAAELLQVAAVAVAWIEDLERRSA